MSYQLSDQDQVCASKILQCSTNKGKPVPFIRCRSHLHDYGAVPGSAMTGAAFAAGTGCAQGKQGLCRAMQARRTSGCGAGVRRVTLAQRPTAIGHRPTGTARRRNGATTFAMKNIAASAFWACAGGHFDTQFVGLRGDPLWLVSARAARRPNCDSPWAHPAFCRAGAAWLSRTAVRHLSQNQNAPLRLMCRPRRPSRASAYAASLSSRHSWIARAQAAPNNNTAAEK